MKRQALDIDDAPHSLLIAPIYTQRLCIRAVEPHDIEALDVFFDAEDRAVYPFLSSDIPRSEKIHARREIHNLMGQGVAAQDPAMLRFVFDRTYEAIIGVLEVFIDQKDQLRISPFMLPSYRRDGYAREALSNTWAQIIDETGLDSLYAQFMPESAMFDGRELKQHSSMALFKSMGFEMCRVRRSTPHEDFHPCDVHEYRCPSSDLRVFNPHG